MKILIIANSAGSLVGFRKPLLIALLEQDIEVHVIAPGLQSTALETKELRALNIIPHDIEMSRTSLNPFVDLKTTYKLYGLMKKIRPNVVLGYTVKPVIYGTIAAWIARIPKRYALITGLGYAFQESADNSKRRIVRTVAQGLYRFTLKRVDAVFFQNPDDELLFLERKILTTRTKSFVVNGSGVGLDEYPESPLDMEKVRFLFIGRLLGDKGIREYLSAARIIKERYPHVEIDLVGPLDINPDAIQQEELDQWIDSGVINYFGRLRDVRPRIAAASVFVLPSYREGTPRSTLEAMSMGRAVITTDAPGCRETVVDGDNGFLVPIKDAQKLAEAMEAFIKYPELIIKMGRRSRQIAGERYDVNKVNLAMLQGMGIII